MEPDQKKVKILKVLLWMGAAYHIPFPLVAMFCKGCIPAMASQFYGFNITMTPQIAWLLNPLATYMLGFGMLLAVTATDPVKYKNFIGIALLVLLVRIIQRALFMTTASGEYISGDSAKILFDFVGCVAYWLALLVMTKMTTCPLCCGSQANADKNSNCS
jgi:hypothetical protein